MPLCSKASDFSQALWIMWLAWRRHLLPMHILDKLINRLSQITPQIRTMTSDTHRPLSMLFPEQTGYQMRLYTRPRNYVDLEYVQIKPERP